MRSLKKLTTAIALLFLTAQAAFAANAPPSYQSVFERLLDNHRVINIVDDFLVFWDQAKDKTPAVQRKLWKRLVENKYPDYFDRAVYRTADTKVRRAMLDEFLIRVPSQVEAIREFNRNISDLAKSPLLEAIIFFKARFREYQQQHDIYIGLSMFRFDGAIRAVQNDAGVPDTLCLGAEVLSSYSHDQIRIAVAHEFFHLYHFGFLFQQPALAEFRMAHMPLMIEGMAIAGAEEVFPYQSPELYLHFEKDELASQQRNLALNAADYLTLIRASAPPELYEQWFTKSHVSEAPSRGGYLLGYEVARRMTSVYGLDHMVRMTPTELRWHALEQLSAMSYDGVLLMASR
jgi:Predicted Zn-dependent protease (DUF2268)